MPGDTTPSLGDTLLRAIGALAVAGLRRDAGFLDPLMARGLVAARFAETDPASSSDPVGLIRDLGAALAAAFRQDPSWVESLGIDVIGLLRKDAVGPAGRMAGALRSDRTLALVEVGLGADPSPVAALTREIGGMPVRSLGRAHLLSFPESEGAIRAVLDIRDAFRSTPVRTGVDRGEVAFAGSDLFGPVVATACRVAAVAEPGETLVTPAVRDQLGEVAGVSFGFVPPRDSDDGSPVAAWSVQRS